MQTPTSPAWETQSSKPRDPAAVDPAPGPARVLRLLDAARPADVAGVLAALAAHAPDALADAVRAVALPLAPAVITSVLNGPPSEAREILACRLVQQPEYVPVRTPGLPEYLRALEDAAADDYRDVTVSRLRTTALDALRVGTLTPEQVVEHTRPAALTVTLGVCTPDEYVQPGARRATGDVRVLIRDLLAEELGTDHDRWSAMLDASGSFGGTLTELLRRRSSDAPGGFRRFFGSPRTPHNPQNLLLGLAPRDVAGRYLDNLHDLPNAAAPNAADPNPDPNPNPDPDLSLSRYRWGWMLISGPLTRPLVDHVLAHGQVGRRRWLFRNELSPDSVLELAGPGYAQEILLRRMAPPHFRRAAFGAFQRDPQQLRTWALNMTGERRDQLVDLMWALTDDAVALRQVIASVSGRIDEPALLCGYGALAFAAGPEPVWALELQRVGSLDAALPEVRASLLTGTAGPLVDAALRVPRRHWLDTLPEECHRFQALRTDAELDRTGRFPREELVAAHLDGRPDRWREVVRWLAAGVTVPVETVIRQVAGLVRTPVGGVAREPATTWAESCATVPSASASPSPSLLAPAAALDADRAAVLSADLAAGFAADVTTDLTADFGTGITTALAAGRAAGRTADRATDRTADRAPDPGPDLAANGARGAAPCTGGPAPLRGHSKIR